MDEERIKLAAQLLGMKPEELISALGISEQEEEQSPRGIEGFYYNSEVFRKLHSIDYEGLRKLVVPDLRRLRI